MKKVLISVCLCGLLMLSAAAAFAADGGHVAVVEPDTSTYVEMTVSSADISVSDGVSVDAVTAVPKAGLTGLVSGKKFTLTNNTQIPVITAAVKLSLTHTSKVSDITVNNTKIGAGLVSKAWISTKADPSLYYIYAATQSGDTVTIKDVQLDSHFSEATILFGSEKTQQSGGDGGGSSGCNAGAATAMLLLSALPLLYFRKK